MTQNYVWGQLGSGYWVLGSAVWFLVLCLALPDLCLVLECGAFPYCRMLVLWVQVQNWLVCTVFSFKAYSNVIIFCSFIYCYNKPVRCDFNGVTGILKLCICTTIGTHFTRDTWWWCCWCSMKIQYDYHILVTTTVPIYPFINIKTEVWFREKIKPLSENYNAFFEGHSFLHFTCPL